MFTWCLFGVGSVLNRLYYLDLHKAGMDMGLQVAGHRDSCSIRSSLRHHAVRWDPAAQLLQLDLVGQEPHPYRQCRFLAALVCLEKTEKDKNYYIPLHPTTDPLYKGLHFHRKKTCISIARHC